MSTACTPWPKRITITVTAADATRGERGDCTKCPAALALNRRDRGTAWSVIDDYADAQNETGRATYVQSEVMRRTIKDFDEGKDFPPGRYRLQRLEQ